ncbi:MULTISPECIES: hypothetical protein [unclassified Haladaptatus]|uniref:DUF7091 family protein n=1 Tax=unclassified Haladaptatus TaxID=2622732 RepID=UPI0007B4915A|nr:MULTISPECIES: hypothetical protein [unclassified Haladaptatus]KZN25901.1 hypothetical protein A4G99_01205 [Haladaptatus sp. R4]MCO8242640.1 hypothetical protein [Haladaptatus sp. AB643]MCO8252400.1 hypothetical protein [Haladaptatus sp. AB618]
MDDRFDRFLRNVGKKYAEARQSADHQLSQAKEAYRNAHDTVLADLPRDEHGRAKIVCRRHVDKRATPIDKEGRPKCFDPDHPACRGCLEDIREGTVETW